MCCAHPHSHSRTILEEFFILIYKSAWALMFARSGQLKKVKWDDVFLNEEKSFAAICTDDANFSLVMNKGDVVQQKNKGIVYRQYNRSTSQFWDIKCSAIKHLFLACFVNGNAVDKNKWQLQCNERSAQVHSDAIILQWLKRKVERN